MKTLNRILLSPDDGTPGSAPAPSAAAGVFADAPAAPVTPPAPDAPATPAAPVAPAPVGLSEEQLTKILNGAIKGAQPAASAAQFSQEDFDRTFNVFKPNKELLNAIR